MQANNSLDIEQEYKVRKLEVSDKSKGFIELLSQLTVCDAVSDKEFEERFREISSYNDDQLICVIEDDHSRNIIATGSVFIEKKFIRSCAKVGHIEDVVVDGSVRGKQLGKKIIEFLVDHARSCGCYKVQYEGDSGRILDEGTTYNLKQMHWHSPSEHQIDGQQFAAELHLFHKSNSYKIAVVGILYQYGDPDPFLTKINYKLEELAKEGCSGDEGAKECSDDDEEAHIPLGYLDNKLLRKKTRRYYRYISSLTTPPCSENVIWIILGKVRTISKEQVEALKAPLHDAYEDNSRPVQSLNGRQVELYDELAT